MFYTEQPARKLVRSIVKNWAMMAGGLILIGTANHLVETLWDNPDPAWDPWMIHLR